VKQLIFVSIVLMLAGSLGSAQSPKIAYVNSEIILQQLPEAQAVKKELETTYQKWQAEYQRMVKEFQDESDDYQKKQALLDPKAKADKEKVLEDLRKQILDYQTQKFDQRDGEIAKLRQEKFAPIQERVMKVIEQVAKDNGYNFVFDKLETAAILLYADSKFDLTYKVLDRLQTGSAVDAQRKSKDTK
jgi:outer membrane protein